MDYQDDNAPSQSANQELKFSQVDKPIASSQMRQRCRVAVPKVEVLIQAIEVNYIRSVKNTDAWIKVFSLRL